MSSYVIVREVRGLVRMLGSSVRERITRAVARVIILPQVRGDGFEARRNHIRLDGGRAADGEDDVADARRLVLLEVVDLVVSR